MAITDRAHRGWVQHELKPFLNTVYSNRPRTQTWDAMIIQAEQDMDTDEFGAMYPADFPHSVEVLRLLLVNPNLLDEDSDDSDDPDDPNDPDDSDDERKPYEGLMKSGKIQDAITIFVRHAVAHGTYNLASHGNKPSRNDPRGYDMQTLLPFYANFDHVQVVEVQEVVPEPLRNSRRNRRNRGGRNPNGGQRGQPAGNGQNSQFQQPQHFYPQLCQSFHQHVRCGSRYLQQDGQQVRNLRQGAYPPVPVESHGRPNRAVQPILNVHNYHHYSPQPYIPGQWNAQQPGGRPTAPSTQLEYGSVTGGPEGISIELANRVSQGVLHGSTHGGPQGACFNPNDRLPAASPLAARLRLDGNAAAFVPQQAQYQTGVGNVPAYYYPPQGGYQDANVNVPAANAQHGVNYGNGYGLAYSLQQGAHGYSNGVAPTWTSHQNPYLNAFGNAAQFYPQQGQAQNDDDNTPQQGGPQNGSA